MPDPSTTHAITTAAVPEWAAEVTVGVPQAQEYIANLKAEIDGLREEVSDLKASVYAREQNINQLDYQRGELAKKFAERIGELADVKAECCRLTCRNGDLEMANAGLKAEARSMIGTAIGRGSATVSVSAYWFDRFAEAVSDKPAEPTENAGAEIKVGAGEFLGDVVRRAITTAKRDQVDARFVFNGTPGVAHPKDDVDTVWVRWHKQRAQDQEARK